MSFLEDLYDKARGVFNDIADFELGKLELRLAQQAQAAEQATAASQSPSTGVGGFNINTVLIIAAVGVGGFLLLKALK